MVSPSLTPLVAPPPAARNARGTRSSTATPRRCAARSAPTARRPGGRGRHADDLAGAGREHPHPARRRGPPGWLATTARRQSLRARNTGGARSSWRTCRRRRWPTAKGAPSPPSARALRAASGACRHVSAPCSSSCRRGRAQLPGGGQRLGVPRGSSAPRASARSRGCAPTDAGTGGGMTPTARAGGGGDNRAVARRITSPDLVERSEQLRPCATPSPARRPQAPRSRSSRASRASASRGSSPSSGAR